MHQGEVWWWCSWISREYIIYTNTSCVHTTASCNTIFISKSEKGERLLWLLTVDVCAQELVMNVALVVYIIRVHGDVLNVLCQPCIPSFRPTLEPKDGASMVCCCAVLPGWKMKCGEGKKLRTANGQRLHSVGVRKRNTKRKFQQYVPVEYSTSLRVFRTRNQGWGWTNVLGSKIWESHVLVV